MNTVYIEVVRLLVFMGLSNCLIFNYSIYYLYRYSIILVELATRKDPISVSLKICGHNYTMRHCIIIMNGLLVANNNYYYD